MGPRERRLPECGPKENWRRSSDQGTRDIYIQFGPLSLAEVAPKPASSPSPQRAPELAGDSDIWVLPDLDCPGDWRQAILAQEPEMWGTRTA